MNHQNTNNQTLVSTSISAQFKCSQLWYWIRAVVLCALFVASMLMNGDIKPFFRRGFFCDDLSIIYPYKDSTVNMYYLFLMSLIIPSVVIKLCDIILSKSINNKPAHSGQRKTRKSSDSEHTQVEEEGMIGVPTRIKRRLVVNDVSHYELTAQPGQDDSRNDTHDDTNWFSRVSLDSDSDCGSRRSSLPYGSTGVIPRKPTIGHFQLFLFGFIVTLFFTGLGKLICGRFRPHFMTSCEPLTGCTSSTFPNKYIENFECKKELTDRGFAYITTSWPSGHASVMFYSMTFMVIYLNTVIPKIVRLSSNTFLCIIDSMILYTIYVLMFGLALFTAITRITDYHHHASDVLSGGVIGSIIGIINAKVLFKQFFSIDCVLPNSE